MKNRVARPAAILKVTALPTTTLLALLCVLTLARCEEPTYFPDPQEITRPFVHTLGLFVDGDTWRYPHYAFDY